MKSILLFCLCVASVYASDDWGGGAVHSRVKTPAFVLPIPEVGITLDKIPLFLPLPKIVLRHNPTLITKPVAIPVVSHGISLGHGGGHGLGLGLGGHGSAIIKLGGHGGLGLGGHGGLGLGGHGGLW